MLGGEKAPGPEARWRAFPQIVMIILKISFILNSRSYVILHYLSFSFGKRKKCLSLCTPFLLEQPKAAQNEPLPLGAMSTTGDVRKVTRQHVPKTVRTQDSPYPYNSYLDKTTRLRQLQGKDY